MFLHWLGTTSVAGTASLVLALALIPWARKLLGARAAFVLWIFPLVAFVIPSLFPSPAGVLPRVDDLPPVVATVFLSSSHDALPTSAPASTPAPAVPWVFIIWATGAFCLFTAAAVRWLRTLQIVHQSTPVTGPLPDITLPRRTSIRESGLIHSPAMCGLFSPVILLPLGWADRLDPASLRWILLHEKGHICRGDMLWSWCFQVVRALHWFNPLMWLAERTSRIDMEMACDEWVLSHERSRAEDYGEAILRIASLPSDHWYMRTGMAESRRGLTRRIRHLAVANPRGWWSVVIAVALGTCAMVLLSPSANSQSPQGTPTAASHAGPRVEIGAKFIEMTPALAEKFFGNTPGQFQSILKKEAFEKLIKSLSQAQGVDLASSPKVTTRSGQRAIIQVVREFRYPSEFSPPADNQTPPSPNAFVSEPVGLTLEVEPFVADDERIILNLKPRMVELLGLVDYAGAKPKISDPKEDTIQAAMRPAANTSGAINMPVFRTREMQTTAVLRSGETIVLGGLSHADSPSMTAFSGGKATEGRDGEHVLYTLITVRITPADDTEPPASPPPPRAAKGLPSGVPVPEKPGFITSPYAPDSGFVDVRGIPSGSEVKCPYTGKLFLVP